MGAKFYKQLDTARYPCAGWIWFALCRACCSLWKNTAKLRCALQDYKPPASLTALAMAASERASKRRARVEASVRPAFSTDFRAQQPAAG